MPNRSKLNILWVVTTQWRGQACRYAGDVNARTPAMDRLAAESVNFTRAVTPHPFGPFARAALLTGVPSPENGVEFYDDPLPENAWTVAHDLREAGYFTGYFGKWHLAPRARGVPLVGETHAKIVVPESRRGGFDFWEGFEGGFLLNDPWLHGTDLPEPVQYRGYQSAVLAERAKCWLSEQDESRRPWFAVVSMEAPHPPYGAEADGVRAGDPAGLVLCDNVPRGGEIEIRARRELAGYYAHIEATDRAIGRLIESVDPENTIVVVTSVHGDMHGSHGRFRKGWPYEESVRVPLLVRHPDWRSAKENAPVSLLGLRSMTRAWARGEPWEWKRNEVRISMPSVVELPDQGDCRWRGIYDDRYKLVLKEEGEPWGLFDLQEDPEERCNLIDDPTRRRIFARLQARLESG